MIVILSCVIEAGILTDTAEGMRIVNNKVAFRWKSDHPFTLMWPWPWPHDFDTGLNILKMYLQIEMKFLGQGTKKFGPITMLHSCVIMMLLL